MGRLVFRKFARQTRHRFFPEVIWIEGIFSWDSFFGVKCQKSIDQTPCTLLIRLNKNWKFNDADQKEDWITEENRRNSSFIRRGNIFFDDKDFALNGKNRGKLGGLKSVRASYHGRASNSGQSLAVGVPQSLQIKSSCSTSSFPYIKGHRPSNYLEPAKRQDIEKETVVESHGKDRSALEQFSKYTSRWPHVNCRSICSCSEK